MDRSGDILPGRTPRDDFAELDRSLDSNSLGAAGNTAFDIDCTPDYGGTLLLTLSGDGVGLSGGFGERRDAVVGMRSIRMAQAARAFFFTQPGLPGPTCRFVLPLHGADDVVPPRTGPMRTGPSPVRGTQQLPRHTCPSAPLDSRTQTRPPTRHRAG